MKIPKKFQAGLNTYNVSQKRMKVQMPNGNEVRGFCDSEKHLVWVSPEQSAQEKLETFFHEFFHAQIGESGVRQASVSLEIEEVIVEVLSKATVKLLKMKK